MKHSIQLFMEGRYKVISERMIEVDTQTVTKKTKKGNSVLTCSCDNSSRFAHNQMCRHKNFFIMLPFLKAFETKIKDMEIFYRGAKELNKEIKPGIVLEELKDLRRMEWVD